jgi:hypothetical protein
MEWKNYWTKVVARYQVMIEGWPASIPFKNLSVASSPLADLNLLLQRWQDGMTHWKQLTSDETEQLINDKKSRGEIQEQVPRRTRSDRGKKRKRQAPPTDESDGDGSPAHSSANRNQKRQKRQAPPGTDESDGGSSPAHSSANGNQKHRKRQAPSGTDESDGGSSSAHSGANRN